VGSSAFSRQHSTNAEGSTPVAAAAVAAAASPSRKPEVEEELKPPAVEAERSRRSWVARPK
jgi:hypothetical protein